MKNREKFREEIKRELEMGIGCSFMREFVNPKPFNLNETDFCERYSCQSCSKLFAFWLDEEYIEPPKPGADWRKVPVDTLVRVRDYECDSWRIRYFRAYNEEAPDYKYSTWENGTTSKTTGGFTEAWRYCELAEGKDV